VELVAIPVRDTLSRIPKRADEGGEEGWEGRFGGVTEAVATFCHREESYMAS
jgi:hypothetical protein